jgi:hypothetical protein
MQANTGYSDRVGKTIGISVTLRKETPLIQIIDRPILPWKKEKFGKAKEL